MKTIAQHTPGSWSAEPTNGGKAWSVIRYPTSEIVGTFRGEDAEANARLMAAAPALLRAVQEALWAFDTDAHHDKTPGRPLRWHNGEDAAIARLRIALANLSIGKESHA